MTIKEALEIVEKVTTINPADQCGKRSTKVRVWAIKIALLLLVEEGFAMWAIAEALNTSEGNAYYHLNSASDLLTYSREFKRLYWQLRAAVEEFEDSAALRAA